MCIVIFEVENWSENIETQINFPDNLVDPTIVSPL